MSKKKVQKCELYDGLSYGEYIKANKDNTKLDLVLVESLQKEYEDENGEKKMTFVHQDAVQTVAEHAVLYYRGVRYEGSYERRIEHEESGDVTRIFINGICIK